MNLFVDTSVWSLALRRDQPGDAPAVRLLVHALMDGETIVTTGIVLQGFSGAKAQAQIVKRFDVLPMLSPDRDTHIAAAQLRNACRRRGVQLGTVDALLAQLCIEHDLAMLTTDHDFTHAARHVPLRLAL